MPRLEYDVVFNLDKGSVKSLRDQLDTEVSEQAVKDLRDEVSKLQEQVEGTGSEATESFSKAEKATESWGNALNQISSGKITQIGNASDQVTVSISRASNSAKDLRQSISLANSGLERAGQTAGTLSGRLDNFGRQAQFAGSSVGGMSKTANNANQILFSFGDAVQDGAQFQNGFASGARAVGNNITFASEQISLAITKAGSFSGAMKTMGSALMGPAGAILLINGLVTAFTVLPNIIGESTQEVTAFKDALSSINSEMEDFLLKQKGLQDQGSILSTEAEEGALRTQLENQEAILERARAIRREGELAEAGRVLPGITADNENLSDLNKLISQTEDRIDQLKTEISATDLLATTPQALQVKTEEARNTVESTLGEDVIIPANIQVDIPGLRQQIQNARNLLQDPGLQQGISIQTPTGDEITPEEQQANEERRKALDERQRKLNEIATKTAPKAERSLRQVALAGVEVADSGQSGGEGMTELEKGLVRAGSQAIVSAESFQGAANAVIDAVIAEIVAFAIRSAIRDIPFPANIAAAAGAAASGAALANLIPDFGGDSSNGARAGGGGSPDNVTFQSSAARRPKVTKRDFGQPFDSTVANKKNSKQPIVIQGDINSVAAAFKIREGEAQIRKQQGQ